MIETIGPYKILDRIGAGGLGDVYRARDTRLGRTVAIKVLPSEIADDPARRDRFLREARAAAALSHPNIAALYEIGEDQGHMFLAFEFVPGDTLTTVIGGRPLNPRRAIDFAVQIADALADAHAEGIVHRDIEPANIIITPKDKAKVLDFGLAAWTAGGAGRGHAVRDGALLATGAGTLPGPIPYMSPEQALGENVDQRTDIFSLGVVLFEMLTGKLPFAGATPAALTLQIVQAPAPLVSAANRLAPKELEPILARALAKSLEERYESAATFAAELRSVGAILDVRSDAAPPPIVEPARVRRRRSVGGWIVLLFALGGLGAAAWFERATIERLWRRTVGPPPPPLIAVLPLELAEPDRSKSYFADGLTEDLISRLGQTPGLTVLGRSTMRTSRGRPPGDVARELGAGVVLTGSITPADTVRIALQLIDPRDGTPLWSGQYSKDVRDIFAVQAQMAGEIASALRVAPQPTRAREVALSRVVDPRAYELYLRGREAAAERRSAAALAFYEQATAADAGLGEAFAGVAEALELQIADGGATVDATRRVRLQSAAKRAYELDPDLPQANVAMALGTDALGDALKYFRHAIELDPSCARASYLVGDAIVDFDPAQAVAFFRRSLALDPGFAASRTAIASALARLGRDDDARSELQAVSSGGGGQEPVAQSLALADLRNGRYVAAATALAAIPTVRSEPRSWAALATALRLSDRTDEALSEATALAARFPRDCEAKVVLAALRLERREAAAAHRLADGPLSVANQRSPSASEIRCGLYAAAALQNGVQAAALLERVSTDEPTLRGFAAVVSGRSGAMWIDARTYPWMLIARQPAVAEARQRMDAAYAREREVARSVLAGLP
jgi:serine/threonine protein kinase/tetratricopeptide (TPR) repeat protein